MNNIDIKSLTVTIILLFIFFILGFYGVEKHKKTLNILSEDNVSISKNF